MRFKFLFLVLVMFLTCGFTPQVKADELDSNISDSKLSYGMAKQKIIVGTTSQIEVLKLFGSPDNMTYNKTKEVWVYDRFRVETNTNTSTGYGAILLAGGSSSSTQTSVYTKTITIIIEFNKSGIVDDFSMRVGGY